MLDSLFTLAKARNRIERGPLGPYLVQFATELQSCGYKSEIIRTYLRSAHRFGVWLRDKGYSVACINTATVDSYLRRLHREYARYSGRGNHKAAGLDTFLRFLERSGVVHCGQAKPALTPVEKWLTDFDHHLEHVVGNTARTRSDYVRYARRLLTETFGAAEPDWRALKAERITDFLQKQAAKLKPSNSADPVPALRAFLRFLGTKGVVPHDLDGAVIRVRSWSQAYLPRHISLVELQRVIDSCDTNTPFGLRERAIIMILGHLGLRASEVAKLTLDDIDWNEGRVIIPNAKNHCDRVLPLPQQVGDALVAYLQQARPSSEAREIFVRWRAPMGSLRTPHAITKIARNAMKRAGIEICRPGARVLRHTLATQMVRRGATFKEVADILGHRCLSSTAIYAKLDLGSLSKVTMPWPGGAQ